WGLVGHKRSEVTRFLSYRDIPAGLRTKEQWWARGRTIPAKTVPAAVVLPLGASDQETCNYQQYLEANQHLKRLQRLYSLEQTRPFKNSYTEAHRRYYGLFCGHAFKGGFI